MKTTQEILSLLPGSWAEFKLKDYIRFSDKFIQFKDEYENLFVDHTNTLRLIELFTGIPEAELEEKMPFRDVLICEQKLSFLDHMPEPLENGKIKWKDIEEMTHGDYILYHQMHMDPITNSAKIIKAFSKNEMTLEEINELGMDEIHAGFFLQSRIMKMSLDNTIVTLSKELINQMPISRMRKFLLRLVVNFNPLLLKSKGIMAGT